ncbi:M10 family metallopeptidase C-terminal domain-containing protein, partial [Terricaulis sp.]|uniref:M10 family metallopeptidase C-terminal domain-containing protein n=1 Tax=Terricaulis sp. TaxID=2768686 RepID=UPI002AC4A1CD
MPLLQMNLAARGSLFSEASVASALGHTSLAGSYESFVCGCAGCAEKAAIALDDGGGALGMFRAAGLGGFRTSVDDIFRLGEDGPQFQGPGGGDTVPGAPNGTFSVAVGGSVDGRTNSAGDDDYYGVQLVAGQSYVISLTGRGGDPLLDPYLELRDSSGALVSINDDSGPGYASTLRFTATVSGTYYINARAYEPANPPYTTGDYTLSVAIGAPQDPLDTIDYNWTVPTTTIEVYFATTGQSFFGETALRSWTQAEINAAMAALATYAAVAPLTFTQTFNQASAEFTLMLHNMDAGVLGYFSPTQGFGAFSPSTTSWQAVGSLNPGGSAFATLVHEFGHALGLAHPHDEGGVRDGNADGSSEVMQGVTNPFSSYGTFLLNQGVFTTMSYNDGWPLGPFGGTGSLANGSQASPMALDVALIQQRYGVNMNYNTGDNTYTLTGVSGSYTAIWDAGGIDTISYAGSTSALIDLRPATLQNALGGGGYVSFVTNVHQGFTIAAGVVIENAVGGSAADTIIGNSAGNRLTGGGSNDSITGNAGIDTSVYTVASTSATWVRNISGAWTITAGANGTDTLNTVEVLDFTDRDVVLDNAQQTFSGDGASDVLWRS